MVVEGGLWPHTCTCLRCVTFSPLSPLFVSPLSSLVSSLLLFSRSPLLSCLRSSPFYCPLSRRSVYVEEDTLERGRERESRTIMKAAVGIFDIRDQNLSVGMICLGDSHQLNPGAPKFEDQSQEEKEWQEQGAREAARKLAKSVSKFKEQERAAFFSPSENRCLPASTLKPEGREIVVDSGASMHMISKKDLSKAEMDTLTKSCSPTIVITANGEVQTHEEVYVKELDIFLTMKVLENTPAVLSLGKLCDENGYSYEWINGQKTHLIKDGIRIICNTENFVPIVVPGLSSSSSASSSTLRTSMKQESHSSSSSSSSPSSPTVGEISVRDREDAPDSDISPVPVSESVDDRSGQPEEIQANQIPKTNKKETTIERGNPCGDSEIPEWLQEFRENLVDDEIPLQGGSHASSSHEVSSEPTAKRREDLGKHSVYTHFPKDRNCEICQRTKITRAPCRRRNGEAVPRAVNFGDLITADHKVLSDNCESRNNHRCAVVVQDLATQWIQAYPCCTSRGHSRPKTVAWNNLSR